MIKHVGNLYDMLGFTTHKQYRCDKCGTEMAKGIHDKSDVKCSWCGQTVPQIKIKEKEQ